MFSQMLPSFLTSMNMGRALSRAALVVVLGLTFLAVGALSRDGLPMAVEASPGYQPAYQEPAAMLPSLGDVELGVNDFIKSAPQGFGDAQNSVIWAMQWWNDKLYVGTNRSWMCWSFASIVEAFPFLGYLYPPRDPDIQCTDDQTDLPLQGEIWAWDPESDEWERVFQSPQDVPIPGTEKFVARDIGFRSMAVFTEPDGTEALYVAGTNSRPFFGDVPPPRILRTTDGLNFTPIPQDPGTFMGDLTKGSFRSLTPYNGKLYVLHGSVQGNGKIIESANPSEGNDAWRQVSPDDPELRGFEMEVFNGQLYVGAMDTLNGYSVVRTDATGEPPYTFIPVVTDGAYLADRPSRTVVSMHIFNDALYVGTDDPAEIIRVKADDSWDLIVGTPRETPAGWKYPLSGLDEGFNFALNQHIWRMQSQDGVLYVGTFDDSTSQRLCPDRNEILSPFMGFDLYKSTDGIHFSAITIDGFGDRFDFGVRNFQSTPHGLFTGTANTYFGANVFRSASGLGDGDQLDPPGTALATAHPDGNVITWTAPAGATQYHIFRSEFTTIKLGIPGGIAPPSIPGNGCDMNGEPETFPPMLVNLVEQLVQDPAFLGLLLQHDLFVSELVDSGLLLEIFALDPAPVSELIKSTLLQNPALLNEVLQNELVVAVMAQMGLTLLDFFFNPELLTQFIQTMIVQYPQFANELLHNEIFLSALLQSDLIFAAAVQYSELIAEFVLTELLTNETLLAELLQSEAFLQILIDAGLIPEESLIGDLGGSFLFRLSGTVEVPDLHSEIGSTAETLFVDTTAVPGTKYSYYVVAQDDSGTESGKSNLISFPLQGPDDKFSSLSVTTAIVGVEIPGLGRHYALFEGQMAVHGIVGPEGQTGDSDGDGLDDIQTEIVSMELTGTHPILGDMTLRLRDASKSPFERSVGMIEEIVNSETGRLDLPPYAPEGAASSFIDAFFEIEVPRLGMTLHNVTPVRIESLITHQLPGNGETHVTTPGEIPLFNENSLPIGASIVFSGHLFAPIPQAVVNESAELIDIDTSFDPDDDRGAAGVFTMSSTFTNTSEDFIIDPSFEITTLTGQTCVLFDDAVCGEQGSRFLWTLSNRILEPGESFSFDFGIALGEKAPFEFFVDVIGRTLLGESLEIDALPLLDGTPLPTEPAPSTAVEASPTPSPTPVAATSTPTAIPTTTPSPSPTPTATPVATTPTPTATPSPTATPTPPSSSAPAPTTSPTPTPTPLPTSTPTFGTVNDLVAQVSLDTDYDPSDVRGAAGVFTIRITFKNSHSQPILDPSFAIKALPASGCLILGGGVCGSTGTLIPWNLGDGVLDSGESFTFTFQIAVDELGPFDFSIDILGSTVR